MSALTLKFSELNGRLVGDNAHKLAILRAFFLKLDLPVTLGKQRVITPNADVCSRVDASTALTHEDVTGNHCLPAVHLHA